jgi:CBS domain-containing protein
MSHTAIRHIHGHDLMPPLRYTTVGDAMHPGIGSCPADATLTEVARLMATHHVHCIAVMGIQRDRQGERSVWGLISDLDAMRAGIRVVPEESAGALALEPIISVDATTGLSEAGELMLKHGVNHIVVIDSVTQQPTGFPSTLDIIDVLAGAEA